MSLSVRCSARSAVDIGYSGYNHQCVASALLSQQEIIKHKSMFQPNKESVSVLSLLISLCSKIALALRPFGKHHSQCQAAVQLCQPLAVPKQIPHVSSPLNLGIENL